MPEASDQKITSLGKRSSTGDSDNENERCPEQKGSQSRAEAELGGQSMSAEALRRLRRRISNRESARRLRKQRNEKLNSLLSQQDNLQGINDCLKAQISAAKDELSRLTDENRGMLLQLGEADTVPALETASRPLADADSVAKPSRTDKNGSVMASEGPSPASSGGLMPAPPPRAIEASTVASSSDLPPASNGRDHPDNNGDSMAANGANPQGDTTQQGANPRSASSQAQQSSAQVAPASTMMTRSSHRAHNTTPKVDMRVAIQELTNVKANAAAGSAAASAAAKAAAAAAAATSPNITSAGHSVPDSMASGFLDRPQAIGGSLGMGGALPTAGLSQPWAHQPVD